jgi:hypothetical protein
MFKQSADYADKAHAGRLAYGGWLALHGCWKRRYN